jgi:undecaprenyl-diphosphatase
MAAFIVFTFRKIIGKWVWLAWLWAALISYAQVYVGVHYPSDILGGAILGLIFGIAMSTFFNKRFQLTIFDNQSLA